MIHHFEDMPVGFRFSTPSVTLSREEIIAFAQAHDPQSFHLDDEAAAESHFGQLVAPGFQTLLAGFRLSLEHGPWAGASMGASGLDELRWLKPVVPGDSLHVEAEVIGAERSKSRPQMGRLRIRHEVVNGKGEVVARWIANHLIKTRAGAEGEAG